MAVSLNALSIIIGMNTDQVLAGVSSMRKQMGRASRIMQMARTDADKLTEGMQALTVAYHRGSIDQEKLAKGLQQVQDRYGSTSKVTKEAADTEKRAQRIVAQSRPQTKGLVDDMRALIQARNAGKISTEDFARSQGMLKQRMSELKAAEARQRAELDGTADAARKAGERFDRVQRTLKRMVPETTQVAMRIRDLRKEYSAGNITADQFRRANLRLREEYRQLNTSVDRTGVSMAEARRRFEAWRRTTNRATSEMPMFVRQLGAAAVALVSLQGIRAFGNVTFEAQKASFALEAYTGSATRATKLVEELQALDARTPLGFMEIQRASETILSFGGNVETLIPTLERLGDISGGSQERFSRLALVFSQISANGRLLGQDLNQMIQSGFNPLQQISQDTGESMTELRDRMKNGAVTAQEVTNAIQSATSEGGRFFGFMDRFSQSAAGSLAKLQSQAKLLAIDMGRLLLPAITKTTSGLAAMIESVRVWGSNLSTTQKKMVVFVGAFTSFILIAPKVIAAFRTIITAIRAYITVSITAQAFSGPAGWATLAAGAAIAAASVWAVNEALGDHNDKMAEAVENGKELQRTGQQYADFVNGIQATVQDNSEINRAIDGYRQQYIELKRGAEAAEDLRLAVAGASREQLEELQSVRAMAKELEKAKKLEQERKALIEQNKQARIQERKQYVESLKRDAESIQESMRTPFQVAQDSIDRLFEMLRAGFIDSATFAKQAQKEFANARGKNDPIAAIEAGSQEAFRFMTGQVQNEREQQLAKMEEQRLLQFAQVEEQKQTNRQLASLQPARRAR